jgi:hypothetical protein
VRFVHAISIEGEEFARTHAPTFLDAAIIPLYDLQLAWLAGAATDKRSEAVEPPAIPDLAALDVALQASTPTLRHSFSPRDLQ